MAIIPFFRQLQTIKYQIPNSIVIMSFFVVRKVHAPNPIAATSQHNGTLFSRFRLEFWMRDQYKRHPFVSVMLDGFSSIKINQCPREWITRHSGSSAATTDVSVYSGTEVPTVCDRRETH